MNRADIINYINYDGTRLVIKERKMIANLHKIPINDRIQLVEDIWDSIAVDQSAISLTQVQKDELDKRLNAYKLDGNKGREGNEVIIDIKNRL